MEKYKIKKHELEQVNETDKIAESEFYSYIEKEQLIPKPKEKLCKMGCKRTCELQEDVVDENKEYYINKMYRILSKKLHPDKTDGESVEVYREITEAHKEHKMEKLFSIMEEYEYDDLMKDEDIYEILVLSCDKTIEEIKSRIHYKWYTSSEADRNHLINIMFVKI